MSKFIGCTIGLECNKGDQIGKPVKVEYYRNADGTVTLTPVSARNLSRVSSDRAITDEQFERRPVDAYNDTIEARWALNLCGWSLMVDDYNDAHGIN